MIFRWLTILSIMRKRKISQNQQQLQQQQQQLPKGLRPQLLDLERVRRRRQQQQLLDQELQRWQQYIHRPKLTNIILHVDRS